MERVLLTGSTGFIGNHVLNLLLSRGHAVTIVVRSTQKGTEVLAQHEDMPDAQLSVAVVPDFTTPGAFDDCLSSAAFQGVIHVASPYHFAPTDVKKDLLDPSIIGTMSLLQAVKDHAPSVRKVILTSSFATILNSYKPNALPEHTYSEEDWNPLTMDDALKNVRSSYRASKLFAEKAAWDFMERMKPTFSLVTMCPTFVFGPVTQPISSIDKLNTSSQRIYDFINGACREKIPDTGISFFLWIDVRDVALAHVEAFENPEVENRRFLLTAGYFCNKEICQILTKKFPEMNDQLPSIHKDEGGYPLEGLYGFDNGRATNELQMQYRTLEESVTDTALSIKILQSRLAKTSS